MDGVKVDHRELDAYRVTLDSAAADALPEARKVVQKGSLNIKNDARRRAPKGPHTPHYERSITYETWEVKTAAIGEIGPDKEKRQGPLGNILEYGTPSSPPQPHIRPAGDAEQPRFEKAMEELAARLLERR